MELADVNYLTFRADFGFAIDVSKISSILFFTDPPPIRLLPDMPPLNWIKGVIDAYAKPVVVIDLRLKLGLPAAASTDRSAIILTRVDLEPTICIGLLVYCVTAIMKFAEEETGSAADFTLLDVNTLFNADEARLLKR